jgi:cell wall-associated NlpC family hydrolase
MTFKSLLRAGILACALIAHSAFADEYRIDASVRQAEDADAAPAAERDDAKSVIDRALDLIGVRYRRGGSSPQTGFDCYGLVNHVFREARGLILPHSSRAISKTGASVE